MNHPNFPITTVPTDQSASGRKERCCWSYAARDHIAGAVAEEIHLVALKAAWEYGCCR